MKIGRIIALVLGILFLIVIVIKFIETSNRVEEEPNNLVTNELPKFIDPEVELSQLTQATVRPNPIPPFKKEGVLYFYEKNSIADSIAIEIADGGGQRQLGLMWRDSLPKETGMFFIFDKAEELSFWMKNCYFPIDIAFVGADKKIINIQKNAKPMAGQNIADDQQPHYPSTADAKYVIEVPTGFFDKKGLKPGTLIDWKKI